MKWSPLAIGKSKSRAMTLDSDAKLMLQFKAGDVDAFEALFSKYSRQLVNFAFRFVRNHEVAEEMAQEIFIRVHDAAPNYHPKAKFATWMYRIAANVCLNEIRRPRSRFAHDSLDCPASGNPDGKPLEFEDKGIVGPDVLLERQVVSQALRRGLAQLPEKQRLAFVLNKYQELSYAEVAEVMKTSEKAVKSLIHRAKEAMAVKLRSLLPEFL
jgi:RNA polymerase sigma-70 factor (ECF subfamily)